MIFALYTSFDTETITETDRSISLIKYEQLQLAYKNTIKCPCSNSANRYERFVSSYYTLHQVCSSDFVNDSWISMLAVYVDERDASDWHLTAAQRFQLLSSLCQIANETIKDAVQRIDARSLITPNLLTKTDFISQLNTTLTQFTQSTIIQFGLLVDTVRLFTRVDQPYAKFKNATVISNVTIHDDGNKGRAQVCTNSINKVLSSLFVMTSMNECMRREHTHAHPYPFSSFATRAD